jgi:hypothetical protein
MKNSLLNFNEISFPERNITLFDLSEKSMRDIPEKYKTNNQYFEIVQVEDSATPDLLSSLYYGETVEWDIVCLENNISPIYDLPKSQRVLERRVEDLLQKWKDSFLPIISQNMTEEEIEKKVQAKRDFFYSIVEKENETYRNLKFLKKNYMIFMYEDVRKNIKNFVDSESVDYKPVFIEGNDQIHTVVVATPIDSQNIYREYDLIISENGTITTVYDISTIIGIYFEEKSLSYASFSQNLITLSNYSYNQISHKQFNVYETDIHTDISFSFTKDNSAVSTIGVTSSIAETPATHLNKMISAMNGLVSVSAFDTNVKKSLTSLSGTDYPKATLPGSTATLLSDNRILIIGGLDGSTSQTTTYFGTIIGNTINWASGTDLPAALNNHTTTLLSDGRILVIGGSNNGSAVDKTYFGTITGNTITWSEGTKFNSVIVNHATVLLPDGRVLITGGSGDSSSNPTSTYNQSTFGTISGNTITWDSGKEIKIEQHSCVLLPDGRVLISGGLSKDVSNNNVTTTYYSNTTFGTISGKTITWTTGSDIPTDIQYLHSSTVLGDGRVLFNGGYKVSDSVSVNEQYLATINGTTITFEQLDNLPDLTSGHKTIFLPDSRVLVSGGTSTKNTMTFVKLKELVRYKLKSLTEDSSFNITNALNFAVLDSAYTLSLIYSAKTFSFELDGFDVIIRNNSGNIADDISYFISELAKRNITATNIDNKIVIASTIARITNLENVSIDYQTSQAMQLAYADVEYNYIPKYQVITVSLNSGSTAAETFSIYINNVTYTYNKADNQTVDASILMNSITDANFDKALVNSTTFTLTNKYMSRRCLTTCTNNITLTERFV